MDVSLCAGEAVEAAGRYGPGLPMLTRDTATKAHGARWRCRCRVGSVQQWSEEVCEMEMERRSFVVGRGSVRDDREFASARVPGCAGSAAGSPVAKKASVMGEAMRSDRQGTAGVADDPDGRSYDRNETMHETLRGSE